MSTMENLSCPTRRTGSKHFKRMGSGSIRSMGTPLTLMTPRPALQWATAVAFLLRPNTCTDWGIFYAVDDNYDKYNGRAWEKKKKKEWNVSWVDGWRCTKGGTGECGGRGGGGFPVCFPSSCTTIMGYRVVRNANLSLFSFFYKKKKKECAPTNTWKSHGVALP